MIVFQNKGEIDVRSISTFGVSVKEGDSPIGFFGTGLKYAIAVLLRAGHRITIHSGLDRISFGVKCSEVRGQSFDFVTMSENGSAPAPIGFTTELGKQWAMWMAYREIACNCKDEGGTSAYAATMPTPIAGHTQIIVDGDEFAAVFEDAHKYILADEPWHVVGSSGVHNRNGREIFYRGVSVMELPRKSLFTYNLGAQIELTEDRTIKNPWEVGHRLAKIVLQSDSKEFIRAAVTAEEEFFEESLDLHGWGINASAEFLDVVGQCMLDKRVKLNATAMKVWKDATKKAFEPREISLSKVQTQSLNKALDFCASIGFQIKGAYPIKVVESLGDGCLGLAEDGTIFVAERVFHLGGTKQLASTLIEEYIHLRHGWRDLTRDLQSFLFDKIVSLGEELSGEPL